MPALIIGLFETPEQSDLISKCLTDAGQRVIVIESFANAKSILKKEACDLILSDVHLQNGGNVFDFLKWVRSNPLSKLIPFVLLSVEPSATAKYLGEGVRYAARILGASKYISMDKFEPFVLLDELAEFLPKQINP